MGYMGGEKNANWKGGIGPLRHREMGRIEYKEWRGKVFERDNYQCIMCGKIKTYLQADHIKSWSDYPNLRYDLKNGRTLCMSCHYFVTFGREMPQGIKWGKFI